MKRENLYISSVADDAVEVATAHGLGLEVAEYCTAFNMDQYFDATDKVVREKMAQIKSERFIFHGPFNELSPAAIDPKVLAVTRERYEQAINLASDYGIKRIVIHSGFTADMYFKEWFESRSVSFWKEFFETVPGDYEIMWENVFERDPEQLFRIAQQIDNPRFKLCFDIGHANVVTESKDVFQWLEVYAPYLGHFHIHNNYGDRDQHNGLLEGKIDMEAFLMLCDELAPNATLTIESLHSGPSVEWLEEKAILVD